MPNTDRTTKNYLAEIEQTYNLIEENFDALFEKAEDIAERQALRHLHSAARDAYWGGVAARLQDGNPFVQEIYVDLVRANQEIKLLTANLQNVGALLTMLKQAVRLAGSIVTLAAL